MSSMLKKGTGAFKPKAPIARRRPAANPPPSQGERAATAESQSQSPASEATPKETSPAAPQTDIVTSPSAPEKPAPPSSTTEALPTSGEQPDVPTISEVPRVPDLSKDAAPSKESLPDKQAGSTSIAKPTVAPAVDVIPQSQPQPDPAVATVTPSEQKNNIQRPEGPVDTSSTPKATEAAPVTKAPARKSAASTTKTPPAKKPVAEAETTAPVHPSQTPVGNESGPSQTDTPVPTIESSSQPTGTATKKTPATRKPRKRKAAAVEGGGEAGPDGTPGEDTAPPKKKRVPRKKKVPAAEGEGGEDNAEGGESTRPKKKRAPRKKKPAAADGNEDEEDETGAEADDGEEEGEDHGEPKKARRKRSVTPEDAEDKLVDHKVTTMAELTKDMRQGQKFSRLDELRDRMRKKRAHQRLVKLGRLKEGEELPEPQEGDGDDSQAGTPAPQSAAPPPPPPVEEVPEGPQLRIVDGQIIMDQGSLTYDAHAAKQKQYGDLKEVVEDEFSTPVTNATYMKPSKISPNFWTDEETVKFYDMLRMFGTDFNMISKTFGNSKTRRQVKLKFNREERHNPVAVNKCIMGEKTTKMDLNTIKDLTGVEYEDSGTIKEELAKQKADQEAEQKRIEEDAAEEARKKREELFGKRNGNRDDDESGEDNGGNKPDKTKKKAKRTPSVGVQVEGDPDVIDETDMYPTNPKGRGKAKKKATAGGFGV